MICILIEKLFTYINNMAFWIIIFNLDVRKLCCYVVWFMRVRQPSAVSLLTHSRSLPLTQPSSASLGSIISKHFVEVIII